MQRQNTAPGGTADHPGQFRMAPAARAACALVAVVGFEYRAILGATLVGENAGEWLAELTLAMKHNLGLNKLLGTIHPYPTLSEAVKGTAGVWKNAHKPERLLGWLARYFRWRRGGRR